MAHEAYIRQPENARQAVLMIHGICGSPRHFDFLLPLFDDSWAVHNILLDGHGGSVRDFSHSRMKLWQQQAEDALTRLSRQYDRILVVGHSMGSLLLLQRLARFPKILGCIFLNVPLHPKLGIRQAPMVLRALFGTSRLDDPREQLFVQDCSIQLSKNPFSYLGWIPRFIELLVLCSHCRKSMVPLPVPAFVVFTQQDEVVSIRSKCYFEQDPSVTLLVTQMSGHGGFLPQEQAQVVAGIREFLRGLAL